MITVYSKDGCGYCTLAKDYLTKNNFEFEEIRIDLDKEKRDWIVEQGHRTVPQIYYKGKLLVEGGGMALSKMDPVAVKENMEKIDVISTTV
jgi:glutaredoxin 3